MSVIVGIHSAEVGWLRAMLVEHADEVERLQREVRYLRHYGNKDCTHMADEAMARGDMDDGERRHSDPSKP